MALVARAAPLDALSLSLDTHLAEVTRSVMPSVPYPRPRPSVAETAASPGLVAMENMPGCSVVHPGTPYSMAYMYPSGHRAFHTSTYSGCPSCAQLSSAVTIFSANTALGRDRANTEEICTAGTGDYNWGARHILPMGNDSVVLCATGRYGIYPSGPTQILKTRRVTRAPSPPPSYSGVNAEASNLQNQFYVQLSDRQHVLRILTLWPSGMAFDVVAIPAGGAWSLSLPSAGTIVSNLASGVPSMRDASVAHSRNDSRIHFVSYTGAYFFIVNELEPIGGSPQLTISAPVTPGGAGAIINSHTNIAALEPAGFVFCWTETSHPLDPSGSGVLCRAFRDDGQPLCDEFHASLYEHALSNEGGASVFAMRGSLSFGVAHGVAASTAQPMLATFTLDGPNFDWNSQTNVVVRTSPVILAPLPDPALGGITHLQATTRIATDYPDLDRHDLDITDLFVAQYGASPNKHVTFARGVITLDGAACTDLGATPLTMGCLQALFDTYDAAWDPATSIPPIGHGFRVHLPTGTWTGCPPEGVRIPWALTLTGDGPEATRIDCGGNGRALLWDGAQLEPGGEYAGVWGLAELTVANGRLEVNESRTGDAPTGGGGVLITGMVGTNLWGHVQNVVFDNCTVVATASAELPLPSGVFGDSPGTTLVGGGLAVIHASDIWIDGVEARDCSISHLRVPAIPPVRSLTPRLYGGGIGVFFTESAAVEFVPTLDDVYGRGVILENIGVSGNRILTSAVATSGGGGGLAVAGLPAALATIAVTHVKATGNTISGASLHGGGILIADFSTPAPVVFLGALTATHNSAQGGAGGGGIAAVNLGSPGATTHEIVDAVAEHNLAARGGGLMVTAPTRLGATVVLSNTTLTSNTATLNGGGLAVATFANAVFYRVVVRDCFSEATGGGVGVLDDATVAVTNATITGCTATTHGGGLATAADATTLGADTTISGNSAGHFGGGAFAASGTLIIVDASVEISGNSAVAGGAGIFECFFSSECGLDPEAQCNNPLYSSNPATASHLALGELGLTVLQAAQLVDLGIVHGNTPDNLATDTVQVAVTADTVPSGTTHVRTGDRAFPELLVQAYDRYGVGMVSPWDARIMGSSQLSLEASTCETQDGAPCDVSLMRVSALTDDDVNVTYTLDVALGSATCVRAVSPLVVHVEGCRDIETKVVTYAIQCVLLCEAGEFYNDDEFETRCDPCPAGTARNDPTHQTTECIPCEGNSYSRSGASFCLDCPPGGDCSDPGSLKALPGFWLPDSNASSVVSFVECDPPSACTGGATWDTCRDAYEGFACSACRSEHARVGRKCTQCAAKWLSLAMLVVAMIVVFIFVAAALRSALRDTGAVSSIRPQIFKIGINTGQTLALIFKLRATASELLTSTAGAAVSMATVSLDLFPVACMMKSSVYERFAVAMAMPPLVILSSLFLFVGVHSFQWRSIPTAFSRSTRASTVLLFMLYPSLVKESFGIFACRSTLVRPGLWLVEDLSIRCYEGTHALVASVAALAIVVYVIGMPLLLTSYLVWGGRTRGVGWLMQRYSFFTGLYRPSVWAWELVIVVRKVAIAAFALFLPRVQEQLMCVGLVLLVMMALHSYMRPFAVDRLNLAELGGIALCMSLVLLLSMTSVDGHAESARAALPARDSFIAVIEWAWISASVAFLASLVTYLVVGENAASRRKRGMISAAAVADIGISTLSSSESYSNTSKGEGNATASLCVESCNGGSWDDSSLRTDDSCTQGNPDPEW